MINHRQPKLINVHCSADSWVQLDDQWDFIDLWVWTWSLVFELYSTAHNARMVLMFYSQSSKAGNLAIAGCRRSTRKQTVPAMPAKKSDDIWCDYYWGHSQPYTPLPQHFSRTTLYFKCVQSIFMTPTRKLKNKESVSLSKIPWQHKNTRIVMVTILLSVTCMYFEVHMGNWRWYSNDNVHQCKKWLTV